MTTVVANPRRSTLYKRPSTAYSTELDGRISNRSTDREEISEREKWWRSTMKDTPNPGAYEIEDFIEELNKKKIPRSYTFKDEGRKRNADRSRKGGYLLPGQYKYQTFVEKINDRRCYASFKGPNRFSGPGIAGIVDKDLYTSEICPFTYAKEYQVAPKHASKDPTFKSKVARFPTVYFKPKIGPAPGQYGASKDGCLPTATKMTSSFKSRTPRFQKVHMLNTPGPGSYAKTYQTPMPDTIKRMGKNYGLFFSSGEDGQY